MAARHEQYTSELVAKHGPEYALKLMERMLEVSRRSSTTLFYDEADYVTNEHGVYELAKTQSKKKAGRQAKRIHSNVNFYTEVIRIIKKGMQNVTKS